MKKIFSLQIIVFFAIGFSISFCTPSKKSVSAPSNNGLIGTPVDSIEFRLINFRYRPYIHKTVSTLLHDLSIPYHGVLFVEMKAYTLAFVSVIYSDTLRLDIYSENYRYLKHVREEYEDNSIWKLEDFLKEKVTKIRVRNRFGKSLKEVPANPKIPII